MEFQGASEVVSQHYDRVENWSRVGQPKSAGAEGPVLCPITVHSLGVTGRKGVIRAKGRSSIFARIGRCRSPAWLVLPCPRLTSPSDVSATSLRSSPVQESESRSDRLWDVSAIRPDGTHSSSSRSRRRSVPVSSDQGAQYFTPSSPDPHFFR